MNLKPTKRELLMGIALGIVLLIPFWCFLSIVPIELADPKPKLPPQENNRVYHPNGFSIIAPQGWNAFIETPEKQQHNSIWVLPDVDARWSPKLGVRILNKNEYPYYGNARKKYAPNKYQKSRYLDFDAQIYEGLWHDYHAWHALFSHQGKNYEVLLMLPHGHDSPRYEKVPDYWWPFLNSFRIDPNSGVENSIDSPTDN